MKKLSIAVLLFLSLGVLFTSCDKNSGLEGTEQTENENVGVHKIVVTTSGNEEATYMAFFWGFGESDEKELYDVNGERVGLAYQKRGNIGESFTCYTEKETHQLDFSLSIMYVGVEETQISYTIDCFINDKKIDSVTKNIKFKGLASGQTVESFEISTKK